MLAAAAVDSMSKRKAGSAENSALHVHACLHNHFERPLVAVSWVRMGTVSMGKDGDCVNGIDP